MVGDTSRRRLPAPDVECDSALPGQMNETTPKGRSHVQNSSHLAEMVRSTTIEPDEVLVSFDVKSLFTSVPGKEAFECVKRILQADAS